VAARAASAAAAALQRWRPRRLSRALGTGSKVGGLWMQRGGGRRGKRVEVAGLRPTVDFRRMT
jgi:hypothetical protein